FLCLSYVFFTFFFYGYVHHRDLHSFPTRRSSDLACDHESGRRNFHAMMEIHFHPRGDTEQKKKQRDVNQNQADPFFCSVSPRGRSEEHTSELQSRFDLVCRLLLEKKKKQKKRTVK